MIINGKALLAAAAIKDMLTTKEREHGVSHGLSEAGYDLRIKQTIKFTYRHGLHYVQRDDEEPVMGRFIIASAMEEFQMPDNLVGVVHDKSTWARQGLSIFNTVVESGWKGWLTLELVHHGNADLIIPAGAGIAQVLFAELAEPSSYAGGKYQNQPDRPVPAILE